MKHLSILSTTRSRWFFNVNSKFLLSFLKYVAHVCGSNRRIYRHARFNAQWCHTKILINIFIFRVSIIQWDPQKRWGIIFHHSSKANRPPELNNTCFTYCESWVIEVNLYAALMLHINVRAKLYFSRSIAKIPSMTCRTPRIQSESRQQNDYSARGIFRCGTKGMQVLRPALPWLLWNFTRHWQRVF